MALLKGKGLSFSCALIFGFHNRNIMALLKGNKERMQWRCRHVSIIEILWLYWRVEMSWKHHVSSCSFHNRNIMALLKGKDDSPKVKQILSSFHNRNIMALLKALCEFTLWWWTASFHNRNIMALLKVITI